MCVYFVGQGEKEWPKSEIDQELFLEHLVRRMVSGRCSQASTRSVWVRKLFASTFISDNHIISRQIHSCQWKTMMVTCLFCIHGDLDSPLCQPCQAQQRCHCQWGVLSKSQSSYFFAFYFRRCEIRLLLKDATHKRTSNCQVASHALILLARLSHAATIAIWSALFMSYAICCFCLNMKIWDEDTWFSFVTQTLRLKGGAAQTEAKQTIRQLMEAEKLSESAIRVSMPVPIKKESQPCN